MKLPSSGTLQQVEGTENEIVLTLEGEADPVRLLPHDQATNEVGYLRGFIGRQVEIEKGGPGVVHFRTPTVSVGYRYAE